MVPMPISANTMTNGSAGQSCHVYNNPMLKPAHPPPYPTLFASAKSISSKWIVLTDDNI